MGRKITPGCEVRLKRLKMEEVLTTQEADTGEVFEQREVLHSKLAYTLIPKGQMADCLDVSFRFVYLHRGPHHQLNN